ncbi:MAG: N-acetyltransferase [Firmicutes bacterium]|nr:N-acetyltransferase [Bacillota bacterium]
MMKKTDIFKVIPYTKEIQEKFSCEFDCGNDHISNFLRSSLALNDSFGKTYISVSEESEKVIGYYNISMGYIESCYDKLPVRLGGAVHINYFAVDRDWQKKNIANKFYISDMLLNDCIERVMFIRKNYVGCAFITLASTEEGYNLYCRNGFEELEAEDMTFTPNESEKSGGTYMYFALETEE